MATRAEIELIVTILRDWGTCFDLHLYEDAVRHCFGGAAAVDQEIDIVDEGHRLGRQTVRLIDPGTAFKLTSLRRDLEEFECHIRRFLRHTELRQVLWVNITLEEVSFVSISERRKNP